MKMNEIDPDIDESWKTELKEEFEKPYFGRLRAYLVNEKKKHTIYPPGKYIFNAFNKTPFNDVKVIILGQDPYHGPGQAHGLSFSVPSGIKTPPSLVNIFKEISEDLNLPTPSHGNLESWAAQGVLLLNSTLTVRANLAGSHQRKGWENFTDAIIKRLSDRRENLVFLLWGRFSQNKSVLIDEKKHLILQAPHPSPLSAYTGFFGCRHFSKTNEFLLKKEKDAIDWTLPN
jgi:uracil-DNA glycosylase